MLHAASEIRCAFFKGLVKTSIRHLLRLIIPISSFTSVNASLISKFSVSTHMLKCRLLKILPFRTKGGARSSGNFRGTAIAHRAWKTFFPSEGGNYAYAEGY